MKKNAFKIAFVTLCTLLFVFIKPNEAFCNEQTDEKGSFQIEYIFEDVEFAIYKIADVSSENGYVLCSDFESCQVDINSNVSSKKKEQAEVLEAFIAAQNISPLSSKSTNEYGFVTFHNLEKGIYLITGKSVDNEGYTYTPLPILLNVPDNSVLGQENYDMIIEPKYEKEQIIIPEEPSEPEPSPEGETKPTPTDKPKQNIPQTGQEIGHIVACGYLAVALFVVALIFRKNKNILRVTAIGGSIAMCFGAIFIVGNIVEDADAESKSKNIVSEMKTQFVSLDKLADEDYLGHSSKTPNSGSTQDTMFIDGKEYIGIISIPKLDRELPVINELTKANMKLSPCLYYNVGDMMVIGAHNYDSMFGTINKLEEGDTIIFTDVNNNSVYYKVSSMEILNPDENDILLSGDCDITLFTCTYGGKQRVVVRCNKIV